jgi:small subunit ribosomal protein S8
MSNNDHLANVMSHILNYEKGGKTTVTTKSNSKVIRKILAIMQENGYLGSHEETTDSKGNILVINLIGAINKCGAIKPRYSVKENEFEKFEKRFLPSKDFGMIIVSTNQGLMTHKEAKSKGIGGTLISYCY